MGRIKQQAPVGVVKPSFFSRLTEPQAMVLVALVGLLPSTVTGVVTWYATVATNPPEISAAEARLDNALRATHGFRRHLYTQYGFGFVAPAAWQVEDYATRFGVADIDVVQRYTDSKAAIGVEFKLVPVQPNYVNDIGAEVLNQADVWKKEDPNLSISDGVVSGFPAKVFRRTKVTGERSGDIRTYWVRIVPEVKLQVTAFTYTDEPDRDAFWAQAERIVESVQFDRELLERRR